MYEIFSFVETRYLYSSRYVGKVQKGNPTRYVCLISILPSIAEEPRKDTVWEADQANTETDISGKLDLTHY